MSKSVIFIVLLSFFILLLPAFVASVEIKETNWESEKSRLLIKGIANTNTPLIITNAYNPSQILGQVNSGEWKIENYKPNPIPCKVKAQDAVGNFSEKSVTNAPKTCGPKAIIEPPPPPPPPPLPANIPPIAKINGPYNGTVGEAIRFDSTGSIDKDGLILSYVWNFGDNTTGIGTNPIHRYTESGDFTVTLIIVDDNNTSATATINVSILAICTSSIVEHCNIKSYTGPEICVQCHKTEAMEMHGSVHYQQGGVFPNVTNIPKTFLTAGEYPAENQSATGINTYCGSHENSPRFTCVGCHVGNGRYPMAQSEFLKLDPNSNEALTELSNIDCLTCHQEVYKRFPDWTFNTGQGFEDFKLLNLKIIDNVLVESIGDEVLKTGYSGLPIASEIGDFQFKPVGKEVKIDIPTLKMSLTTVDAARFVHITTRKSCLNCHAGAGGSNGGKRGDISLDTINPTIITDIHMSQNGQNLTCANCHDAGNHRMKGRGLDLRANDVPERFTCDSGTCHSKTPHDDYSNLNGASIDKHAMKIACQTCHIPRFAKSPVGTEIARDWQRPHPSNAACNGRGGWLPEEVREYNLVPTYKWFNGTSKVAYLGEKLDNVNTIQLTPDIINSFNGNYSIGDKAYILGEPNGTIYDSTAKIYPMKEHWGKLAKNDTSNTLIAHSTFEFFRTGSFCRAVDIGLGNNGDNCNGIPGSLEMPENTTVVPVFTYQTINHGVESKDKALGCGSCHTGLLGGTKQLDLSEFNYGLRTFPSVVINTGMKSLDGTERTVCIQCHKIMEKKMSFSEMHKKHVQDKKRECSACHNFSRPERILFLSNIN